MCSHTVGVSLLWLLRDYTLRMYLSGLTNGSVDALQKVKGGRNWPCSVKKLWTFY